jgi:hypothetical protein
MSWQIQYGAHNCSPSTLGAETEGLWVQVQPGIYRKPLFQKNDRMIKRMPQSYRSRSLKKIVVKILDKILTNQI